VVGRGGHVISTVSTPEKAQLSRAAGARHVINYAEMSDISTELPARVRELTGGAGVSVVYDSVGRTTFDASLACLRPRGVLVLFGASSGQVPPFDLQRLNSGGSLYITRPNLAHYVATRDDLEWRALDVMEAITEGLLSVRIGAKFGLPDAAAAHEALASRQTTGKVLLIPGAEIPGSEIPAA
jgi:NADPH2:quinone reductase